MNSNSSRSVALLACLVFPLACSRGQKSGGSGESAVSAATGGQGGPAGDGEALEKKAQTAQKRPHLLGSRVPVGPRLVIQPGKSVGPIFFGATKETIERLMAAPCDITTADQCIYIKQALVFRLNDGVLVRATAHLRDRPVPGKENEAVFGTFNGGMAPEIMLGLHRHIVLEEFGKPLRQEDIPLKGETGLVARHFYDGVTFEYDKIDNGNVVLAAIEVVPSKTAETVPATTPEKRPVPTPTKAP